MADNIIPLLPKIKSNTRQKQIEELQDKIRDTQDAILLLELDLIINEFKLLALMEEAL